MNPMATEKNPSCRPPDASLGGRTLAANKPEPSTERIGIIDDARQFQGTWKQIGYERDGVKNPLDEQGWNPSVTFTDDTFVVTLADGSVPIKGIFELDLTTGPKSMDMTDTFGAEAGMTLLAIYSLGNDVLTFCAAYPGLERPTKFSTRPGQVLRVFQRVRQDAG